MEISLIISGNLTGFSRFYASPNANDVYNEAKFDFDYRNFLTFLNAGEKAYAISFSPKIIAVSLITRILDSFRRPGILVVTALIPRYQFVRGQLNQNDKTAIFKLLNEVNDKFYEKNFLNGMVNQNPAVLMQDYYSDILSRYTFVNDRMQKPVNSRIDVTSPNKRIGYVAAPEGSMPQYLSSVMRKSYEGYHHVFLSPHAPQNIDEPAEEILTYKVRIENGNRPVPGEVRLTDRIPNINPEQGEKDIPNKNFTYGQVLSGEAGTDIIGSIENGDTIVISYRFPKDEKTVYFRFYEGANEVPMALIRPVIVDSNGTSFNIPSDSYTFYGKEIYGRKTIKSGNPDYSIVGAGANLDLQRVQNGATININVERGWLWQFAPMWNNRPATIKPVNITLINRYNGDRRTFTNVTSAISEKLSGNQSEWEMVIESDFYMDVRVPVNTPYRLDPKPVQQRPTTPTGNNGNGGRTVNPHNRTTSTGQNDQGLRISKGEQHTAKDSEQIRREKNKRYMTYGVAVIAACLLVFGGIWGYKALFGEDKDKTEKEDVELIVEDSQNEKKNFTLSIVGVDGDPLSQSTIDKLTVTFDPEKIVELNSDGNGYCVKYNPNNNPTDKVKVNVSYVGCDLLGKDYKNIYEVKDLPDVVTVNLSVKESDINLYDKIEAGVSAKDYDKYEDKVRDIAGNLNGSYGTVLSKLLSPQKPQTSEPTKGQKEEKSVKEDSSSGTDKIRDGFNALHLLLSPDKSSLMSDGQKLRPQNKAEEDRNEALINVLTQLNGGAVPASTPRALSSQQQKIINDLRRYAQGLDNSGKAKLRSDLKKWKSLSQIQANILPK